MDESPASFDRVALAHDIAAGAVAEAGRWRAFWALGRLIILARCPSDVRDVALILAAVLRA